MNPLITLIWDYRQIHINNHKYARVSDLAWRTYQKCLHYWWRIGEGDLYFFQGGVIYEVFPPIELEV